MPVARTIPVFDLSNRLVGRAPVTAHKKAAALARASAVKQEVRNVDGFRTFCWVAYVRTR